MEEHTSLLAGEPVEMMPPEPAPDHADSALEAKPDAVGAASGKAIEDVPQQAITPLPSARAPTQQERAIAQIKLEASIYKMAGGTSSASASAQISTMPIADIKIGVRHRTKIDEIDGLARSITEVGLLHPIVVRPDGTLIAGERRLAAFKQLGRTDIPVTVVDLAEIVRGELAENTERKNFLPSEIEAIRRTLAPIERAAAKERQREHGGTAPGKHSAKVSPSDAGKTSDKIGAFAGVSGRTVEKIAAVITAAERDPEKFGHLVDEMDRAGKVSGAHRKLMQAMDERRVLSLVPVAGKFRTLVLDPAWEYDWLSIAGRAKPGYAMQTHEQLLALDVKAWADEENGCQLYLWVTNNFSGRGHELIAHWGFQFKTKITWIKPPPFGLGSYFRNSTEHVLFATLGKTTTRHAAASIPTHFEAPRGEHSEKPERFYEIVRASSYPPYGEGNQRKPRPDFTNLYCPVTEGEAPPPIAAEPSSEPGNAVLAGEAADAAT
jgi:ParB-like chromosome segregation protein Spo0J/N6-adenosine-specific RNA methylase IME4